MGKAREAAPEVAPAISPDITPDTGQDLVGWVAAALGAVETEQVRMFGGTGFMLNGNLLAAASKRGLLLRVGEGQRDKALARKGARTLQMRGKTMKDYIYVDASALSKVAVGACIRMALKFVETLPANAARSKGKAKSAAAPRSSKTRDAR